jgi:hypothetical protein
VKPIVFLDIDGVLNSAEWLRSGEPSMGPGAVVIVDDKFDASSHLEPSRIAMLNRIVEATGAQIVLSTSWRCLFGPGDTESMLRRRGLVANIVGSTPRIYDVPRGREISAWLGDSGRDDYVILDDDADAGVGHDGHFVQCRDGITESEVIEAIARLGVMR